QLILKNAAAVTSTTWNLSKNVLAVTVNDDGLTTTTQAYGLKTKNSAGNECYTANSQIPTVAKTTTASGVTGIPITNTLTFATAGAYASACP
ncbi:MAG: hypothetical protein Q9M09_01455, partial [Mariprofundaceae bacterium]|nr:hypothetical protein [Mariprofundaceae bacterium]